jgi:hypothetical protein
MAVSLTSRAPASQIRGFHQNGAIASHELRHSSRSPKDVAHRRMRKLQLMVSVLCKCTVSRPLHWNLVYTSCGTTWSAIEFQTKFDTLGGLPWERCSAVPRPRWLRQFRKSTLYEYYAPFPQQLATKPTTISKEATISRDTGKRAGTKNESRKYMTFLGHAVRDELDEKDFDRFRGKCLRQAACR